MRAMKRALTSVFCLVLATAAVAQQQKLAPMDMFRLNFFMTMNAEEPVAWLDADHYLVFDAGKQPRGPSSWSRVEAQTGKRERYVDKSALLASLGEDVDAGEVEGLGAWTWNESHTRFVLNVGGDLYAAGRDGATVRLTKTPDSEEVGVRFSPDGDSVAFVADYNLHVVPSSGGDVRALTTEGHSDLKIDLLTSSIWAPLECDLRLRPALSGQRREDCSPEHQGRPPLARTP